jgi:NAD(P) transhydrogenase
MSAKFDLVVIGSGPGGLRAAIQGAKLGKRVAIVEKGKPGGGSVHFGTIPSKALREAALSREGNDFTLAMNRMRQSVQTEAGVVAKQLARNHVEFLHGAAKFLNAHRIEVSGTVLETSHTVIATGTRPIQQKEYSFGAGGLKESDLILGLKKKPSTMLVVGAGVIGCEYASIFAKLGVKVTLVDRRADLLRHVDQQMIETMRQAFAESGIDLILDVDLGDPKRRRLGTGFEVMLNKKLRRFDQVLICLGRQPNTEELGLSSLGIETDNRGFIKVDRATFQTNVPHIYAVGDVIGAPGLAAAAAEQGRIAACHIFNHGCPAFPESFPYGIYTIPEISWAGLNETELRERNVDYVVGIAPFSEVARGIISGNRSGFIKLLVQRENRRIAGVHAIGYGATELIHLGQMMMKLNAPVDFLLENVFNYPTFAEAYKVAALSAANQI